MSISTLTETVVEIANQYTNRFYLKDGSTGYPLPFINENKYNEFNQLIYDKNRIDFSELRKNYQPQVLKRLSLGYENYKYWHRLLRSRQAKSYPKLAWQRLLPITATTIPRINVLKDPSFNFRVLPMLRVVLYPFGWSVWISLRILDPHDLDQLALLLEQLFTKKSFQIGANTLAMSLDELMQQISDGVRTDAFGEDLGEVWASKHTLVTTVLAKHNGSYSVAVPQNEAVLGRMIQPEGGLSHKSFTVAVYRFVQQNNDPLEYMLLKDYSRFIWMEHLLAPVERNRHLLRCYHQNTFRLLVHSRHLLALMQEAVNEKQKTVPLIELVTSAIHFFEQATFNNACFFKFQKAPDVLKIIPVAKKWCGIEI